VTAGLPGFFQTVAVPAIITLAAIIVYDSYSASEFYLNGMSGGEAITNSNYNPSQNYVSTIQYLDNFSEGQDQESSTSSEYRMINLTGQWNLNEKPVLLASIYTADNLTNKNEILNYAKSIVFDIMPEGNNATSASSGQSWSHTLDSLVKSQKKDQGQSFPRYVDLDKVNDDPWIKVNAMPDITVLLTDEKHPSENRNGQTIAFIRDGYVIHADITIFTADSLYKEGFLGVVLEHEIGHSLGLSHSNDAQSVMYPKLVIVDGLAIGKIANCEEAGLMALYTSSSLDSVECRSAM
jgi:matrixin